MEHFHSIPWFAWIPIVAIVGGLISSTIKVLVEMRYRHTERMAMIQMGMHPDGEPDVARDPCQKPVSVEEV